MKKTKTIAIVGASKKLGVTHMCLSIANFLYSCLKQRVLYIEIGEESQLLGLVGENQIKIDNQVGFLYKGVSYVIACNVKEALELMKSFKGYIIVDISYLLENKKQILNQCDRIIMIGSMKPWCKKDIQNSISELEGGEDVRKIKYYNISSEKNELSEFKRMSGFKMVPRPFIENPFHIKEVEFDSILEMIK